MFIVPITDNSVPILSFNKVGPLLFLSTKLHKNTKNTLHIHV